MATSPAYSEQQFPLSFPSTDPGVMLTVRGVDHPLERTNRSKGLCRQQCKGRAPTVPEAEGAEEAVVSAVRLAAAPIRC